MNDTAEPAQSAEPEAEKPKFGAKQILATVVTLLTLGFVFLVVFPQFADYSDAWTAIQQMTAGALIALLIATIANIFIYVLPYQAALPGLSYGPAFVIRQTSFMISNVIPAGGAFGLAVQYAMLGDYGVGPARATAGIGITSVWNTFVTLGLPVLAALGLLATGVTEVGIWIVAGVGVVLIGGGIVLFALILRSEQMARRIGSWGDRMIAWFLGLFHKDYGGGLADGAVRFRASTIGVVSERWGRITVTSVLQQLSQFFILYLAILGIEGGSAEVTLIEAFAAFAFARLASFIPVTPGGLGTVDAALTGFLVTAGMANEDALAAVLVWRALSYFPQVILGIGTFLYWRGRKAKLAAAGGSPGDDPAPPA